jgi:ATP-dependent Clp protease ATP-binding subunit ClpA
VGRGDPALERRFQKVVVRELGELETLEILQARKERLERHHNVLISDEALRAAVKLTDAYVTDRMRPDKAIDAIDEACAHMQAVIQYSERTETLIQRACRCSRTGRIEREDEKRKPADRDGRRGVAERVRRFGAELEALFVGAPATTTPVNGTEAHRPRSPSARVPRCLRRSKRIWDGS